MEYINRLKKLGLEQKMIVSALIGKTKAAVLTINEREYLANYILGLERASENAEQSTSNVERMKRCD